MKTFRLERSEEPLLDMPHSAYPAACRTHHYAELGTDGSFWISFSSTCRSVHSA